MQHEGGCAAAARAAVLASHLRRDGGTTGALTASAHGSGLVPETAADEPLMRSSWVYNTVRWMVQKDAVGQDMMLLGPPSAMRRRIAFRFCEVMGREVEHVALTGDTTESDLKQRRELLAGGTVEWREQAVVAAAVHGRVLVVEGLEKVERNVLPVLNNLLENREMHLEDGRFLVAPDRYDSLVAGGSDARDLGSRLRFIRVHPRFRVIAIGVPVPPYPGNPLDPPLRSRFQARLVGRPDTEELHMAVRSAGVAPTVSEESLQSLLTFYESLWELAAMQGGTAGVDARAMAFQRLPLPSETSVLTAARVLQLFPGVDVPDVAHRIFPSSSGMLDDEAGRLVVGVTAAAGSSTAASSECRVTAVRGAAGRRVRLSFGPTPAVDVECWGGAVEPRLPPLATPPAVLTLLARMLQSHAAGADLCLLGEGGGGKTHTARLLTAALGHASAETLFLYEDMTARDLIQRRTTGSDGSTKWDPSPLCDAVREGLPCVLDGVDRLPAGTLAALLRLVQDREIVLSDGTRFLPPGRYAGLKERIGAEEIRRLRIERVDPSFRIIALASPPTQQKRWLTAEVLQLFHFFTAPTDADVVASVITSVAHNESLSQSLAAARAELANVSGGDRRGIAEARLSLRQAVRIARRCASQPEAAGSAIEEALLAAFMPPQDRDAVRLALQQAGLPPAPKQTRASAGEVVPAPPGGGLLRIGSVSVEVAAPAAPELIPQTLFVDIPQHVVTLEGMLRDYTLGEHLLLMGNQGVGKNKLTDRLLMLLQKEREYVQLHRDTTVAALTLTPTMRGGVVVWDDSPLVKAMTYGRVLVIDEFDKAPAEVVVVLKSLLEDGEILLGDGRRFVSPKSPLWPFADAPGPRRTRRVHAGFRVFALANRPGYPFLGNDFFRVMGDVFACHVVGNPDQVSEMELLRAYGPKLPAPLLQKLTAAFQDLRLMVDEGKLSYPYSTRELVNIVKHLSRFPGDSVSSVLENVFSFDSFDPQLRLTLRGVFQRHGIPLGDDGAADSAVAVAVRKVTPPQRLPAPEIIARSERMPSAVTLAVTAAVAPLSAAPGSNFSAFAPQRRNEHWKPLMWRSSRPRIFQEEELTWQIGKMLPEGVLVDGDPLMGHWMGELIAAEEAENCVCVLSSQMELHVHDISETGRSGLATAAMKVRTLPLYFPTKEKWRARFAGAGAMAPVRSYDCLLIVDSRNFAACFVWPRTGRLRTVQLPDCSVAALRSATHHTPSVTVGGLADGHSVALLWGKHGNGLVLLHCGTEDAGKQDVAVIPLPQGVVVSSVRLLGPGAFLVSSEAAVYVVSTNVAGATGLDFLRAVTSGTPTFAQLRTTGFQSVTLHAPVSAAAGAFVSEAHVTAAGVAQSTSPTVMCSAEASVGGVGVGLPDQRGVVFGYRRPAAGTVAERLAALQGAPRKTTWLSRSNTVATCTSTPAACVVELFGAEGGAATLRRVVLTKSNSAGEAPTEEALQRAVDETSKMSEKDIRRGGGVAVVTAACELRDGRLLLVFTDGNVRVLETRRDVLERDEVLWRAMAGVGDEPVDGKGGREGGKGDGGEDGQGSGGRGGRGINGVGGSRLNFEDFDPRAGADSEERTTRRKAAQKGAVQVRARARKAASAAAATQRRAIAATDVDDSEYEKLFKSVEAEIAQLRVVLEAVEAKERERVWLRGQTVGELDDARLVDGAAGDRNIFKRRGKKDQLFGAAQRLAKRISFVVDVSSSMATFNADHRLDRMCATVVLVMESFYGLEHKYCYEIVGHSGQTACLPLVKFGSAPANRRERLAVIREMFHHAGVCRSGDHTLDAGERAVQVVASEPADDYFVFLISDANLQGYGVSPERLASALTTNKRVNSYALFIAEEETAERLSQQMPPGRAHVVMDTGTMPLLFKNIFSSALVTNDGSKM